MSANILPIANLNRRPYVHGTSLTRAVLEHFGYPAVAIRNFNIRLRKVLSTLPIIEITSTPVAPSVQTVATGSIDAGGREWFFTLHASNAPVEVVEIVDEVALQKASQQMVTFAGLTYQGIISPPADIFGSLVAWNVIAAETAKQYFNERLNGSSQLWLVGTTIPDLSFLAEPAEPADHLGISSAVEHITPNIIRRDLIWNGRAVGTRADALAAKQ